MSLSISSDCWRRTEHWSWWSTTCKLCLDSPTGYPFWHTVRSSRPEHRVKSAETRRSKKRISAMSRSDPIKPPLLAVKGLHAYYGSSHVLHGVDLHIDSGEVVSLLGRNGVGRSTLAKAI